MDTKENDIHNQIPRDDQDDASFLHILQEDRAPAGLKQTLKAELRHQFNAEEVAHRPHLPPQPRRYFYTAVGAFGLAAMICVAYLFSSQMPPETVIQRTKTVTQTSKQLVDDLFMAIREQDGSQVLSLIEMGVDVNKKGSLGILPLQASIFLDNPEEISLLLIDAGAAVNRKIFDYGLQNPNITDQLLQKMVDAGEIDVHEFDDDTSYEKAHLPTYLMVATDAQNIVATTYLIEQGVDLDQINKNRQTALHIAAATGNLDLVKQFVESGADVTIADKDELTAADKAKEMEHDDIASYLDQD